MARFENTKITKEFLDKNPNALFIFGDNLQRQGYGGAAALRDHPQSIGFITKKAPNADPESYFKVDEYIKPFFDQLKSLEELINSHPNKMFYIAPLGSKMANRHHIWEKVIRHNIISAFIEHPNVVFCWYEESYTLLTTLTELPQ